MASPLFTLIISVYNVEAWIDEFLASLDAQVGGLDDVELLFVVDGSPDESERRIRDWLDRRDGDASIIVKENGGLSSARNTGLDTARGEWVSFPDPDDVLAPNYLEQVRQAITEFPDIDLFATRIRRFRDSTGVPDGSHPLDYRFARGTRRVDLDRTPRHLHLQAASSIIRRAWVGARRFDLRVKPNFEDAAFIAELLLEGPARYVVIATAEYRYRTRDDGSSLVQRSYGDPAKYTTLLEFGYLPVLMHASATGRVPIWLQTLILYDIQWVFKTDQHAASPTAGLSEEVVERFFALFARVLEYIDPETILEYNATSIGMDIRIAWYRFVTGHLPEVDVHVTALDRSRRLALVRYFADRADTTEQLLIDGVSTSPVAAKTRAIKFFGRPMLYERMLWVSAMHDIAVLRSGTARPDRLRFTGMGQSVHVATPGHVWRSHGNTAPPYPATRAIPVEATVSRRLSLSNRVHRALAWRIAVGRDRLRRKRRDLKTRQIIRGAQSSRARTLYRDAWVLMDRDTVARDNAESLYRYISARRPDLNPWFVIRETAPDYARLKAEGFKLVPYGSDDHIVLMKNASHLISSQVDHYVVAPYDIGRFGRGKWKFTFLQHGVTHNDISLWINRKVIDRLIVTSERERDSIVSDGTSYLLTTKEVALTGFPRHDELLRKMEVVKKDYVLVLPTWRQTLLEPISGTSNFRKLIDGFERSEYFRAWMGFLTDPELRRTAEAAGVSIAFAPHPNLQAHLHRFPVPPWIELLDYANGDVKDWIARARVVVTDYSSLAFDAAFASVPVVYYQFDRETFFSGGHAYRRGEFDHGRDGFGPVCFDHGSAVQAAAGVLLAPDASASYWPRIHNSFAHRDGKNSERVVASIEELDRPHPATA